MSLELARELRNILLRTLAVTFGFTLLMHLSTWPLWDTWTTLTSQWFRVPVDTLGLAMLNFFVAIKFFSIFVLLAPALALHWTIKVREKRG